MKSDDILAKYRERIENLNPADQKVFAIIQYNFTDNGKPIKSFVMDLKNYTFNEGTNSAADAEVTIEDEDFVAIGEKKASLEELIKSGRVKVKGDVEVIKALRDRIK